MRQVSARQKAIQFASRVNSHVRRQAQIHQLRHIVRELTRELPAAALARRLSEATALSQGPVDIFESDFRPMKTPFAGGSERTYTACT